MSQEKITSYFHLKSTYGLVIPENHSNFIHLSNDRDLLYISGNQITSLNLDTKDQRFVHLANRSIKTLSCITISSLRKTLFVGEKWMSNPTTIHLYDLVSLRKKKTTITLATEYHIHEIISMAVSNDGKFLLVQGGSPDWTIMLWNIEKVPRLQVIHMLNLSQDSSVESISFCPWDSNIILALGKKLFKIFRVTDDGNLRIHSPRRDISKATAFCWVPKFKEFGLKISPTNNDNTSDVNKDVITSPVGDSSQFVDMENLNTTQFGGRNNHLNGINISLGDHLVLGFENGEVGFLENLDSCTVIHGNQTQKIQPDTVVKCMMATSRGFIATGQHGSIKVFERVSVQQYNLICTHHLSINNGNIIRMMMSTDYSLICVTDKHQVICTAVSNIYNVNDILESSAENEKKKMIGNIENEVCHFQHILTSFHGPNQLNEASINCIDVSLWKSVIVTCGKDCSVRLWNVADKRIECIQYFDDEPLSVSIHPSGLYTAIAFYEKIKFVTNNYFNFEMRQDMLIRHCTFIKYATGGQYLAAVSGSNINIYDANSFKFISQLRGHTNRVKSFQWIDNDTRMMSISIDGIVRVWQLFSITISSDSLVRRSSLSSDSIQLVVNQPLRCGGVFENGSMIFVVTAMNVLKSYQIIDQEMIDDDANNKMISTARENSLSASSNNVVIHDKGFIIMGSSDPDMIGSIMIHQVTKTNEQSIVETINIEVLGLHAGPITFMTLSPDGNYLYSGDEYGCLHISEIIIPNHRDTSFKDNYIASFKFTDEILLNKTIVDDYLEKIRLMRKNLISLQQTNEHQFYVKEREHKEMMEDLQKKYDDQLVIQQSIHEDGKRELEVIKQDFSNKQQLLSSQSAKENQIVETKYTNKLQVEKLRLEDLQKEFEDMKLTYNEEMKVLKASHHAYIEGLKEKHAEILQSERYLQGNILSDKSQVAKSYQDIQHKTEEEYEIEIEEVKNKLTHLIDMERASNKSLVNINNELKSKMSSLQKNIEFYKGDIKKLTERQIRLKDNKASLEKGITMHKVEIREREESITEKDNRIFDLKKKNQELEKFRFVLDYKIKELKLQIAPRESEILKMKQQIESMEIELHQYHKNHESLKQMIEELNLKLDGLTYEYQLQEVRCDKALRVIKKFQKDIKQLESIINDEHALRHMIMHLNFIYFQDKDNSSIGSNKSKDMTNLIAASHEVYNRDRQQMERSLDVLRKSLKSSVISHKQDKSKRMREYDTLMNEINLLRKEAIILKSKKQLIDETPISSIASGIASVDKVALLLRTLGIRFKTKKTTTSLPQARESKANTNTNTTNNSSSRKASPLIITNVAPPVPMNRMTTLRSLSASSKSNLDNLKTNNYESWRQLQLLDEEIHSLEIQIQQKCEEMNIAAPNLLSYIEDAF